MEVNHRSTAPVMILGHPRSGTSILSRLFRNYLRIAFGTESQFIIRYFRTLHRYRDLNDDRNLYRLVKHITTERWFQRSRKFGLETTPEEIFRDVRERTYRGVLDAVFLQLARQLGMSRWGDKSPNYARHLNVIGDLFPDAKFVHIVRDGRDVALSVMEMPWGPKSVFAAALDWKRTMGLVDDFVTQLPNDRALQITYERLLTDPGNTFQGLIEFLEIDDSDGALIEYIFQRACHDLKQTNFDKWRTRLSEKQRVQFEQIAGDMLRKHRYETIVDEVVSQPPAWQEFCSRCHGKLSQWARAAYWQDNAYKFRMRARDALRGVTCTLSR